MVYEVINKLEKETGRDCLQKRATFQRFKQGVAFLVPVLSKSRDQDSFEIIRTDYRSCPDGTGEEENLDNDNTSARLGTNSTKSLD